MGIGPQPSLDGLLTVLEERISTFPIVTTAPALGDMDVGEIWIGDATESSPAAGSDAVYIKINDATIMVIRTDGTTIQGANIT